MNIAIIGLGFVGLTLSLSLADRGFKIYGVETNRDTLNKINNKIPTINEYGIKEILERTLGKTFFPVMELEELSEQPNTFIICVETPVVDGVPNTTYVTNAVNQLSDSWLQGEAPDRWNVPVTTGRSGSKTAPTTEPPKARWLVQEDIQSLECRTSPAI